MKMKRLIKIAFLLSCILYIGTKTFLNAHNMELSIEDQQLSATLSKAQQKIEELTVDINVLQEKTRVLSILDNKVADNAKNVYIIEE